MQKQVVNHVADEADQCFVHLGLRHDSPDQGGDLAGNHEADIEDDQGHDQPNPVFPDPKRKHMRHALHGASNIKTSHQRSSIWVERCVPTVLHSKPLVSSNARRILLAHIRRNGEQANATAQKKGGSRSFRL
jgi:hypothetical protein